MNTLELEQCIAQDKHGMKQKIIGVFPANQLPYPSSQVGYPFGLIINTDKAGDPGEHWVCMYFNENMNGEYYDPLGYTIPFLNFHAFLKKYAPLGYTENYTQVQSTLSDTCGKHCLFYLYFKCRNIKTSDILKNFNPNNCKMNDIRVNKWFRQIFGCIKCDTSSSGKCVQTCRALGK